MKNILTNGAEIEVISTGKKYHTLLDWGLAIGNNNYIKEPEAYTYFVEVPGRNGMLDLTEAITGYPIYQSRQIELELGGIQERTAWDTVISGIRNKIHGKQVKIVFDNDKAYYWKGRATVTAFDRTRKLGTFNINIEAEPYKYQVYSTLDKWEWDPFSFVDGIIEQYNELIVSGQLTLDIHGEILMPFSPIVYVTGGVTSVQFGEDIYSLKEGKNMLPDINVFGSGNKLVFKGNGTISVEYRRGSL